MAEVSIRRGVSLTGIVVLVLGAAGWAVVRGGLLDSPQPPVAPAIATGVAAVVRTDIAQRDQVNGTLGYEGDYAVQAGGQANGQGGGQGGGQGVLTRLPAIGATVRRDRALYEIDGTRIPLLYGSRPAWRDLALGVTDGVDVEQLERNLAALGYTGLTVDRHFSLSTYYALREWQHDRKVSVTGRVALGQVVFLPGPLRVTGHDAKVGTALQPAAPVLHGTGTSPIVSVQLDPMTAPGIRTGDKVLVTLPDGKSRKGTVTQVSKVAQTVSQPGASAISTIPITIRLSGGMVRVLDQAVVQVAITSEEHRKVLAVPIVALLAQPGGRFAVVTVSGTRHVKVPVETGLFDETAGLVEVDGVSEGAQVEVPSQ